MAKKVSQKTLRYFISLSAGFILAAVILDFYPEVIRNLEAVPLLILLGFASLFVLENFLLSMPTLRLPLVAQGMSIPSPSINRANKRSF